MTDGIAEELREQLDRLASSRPATASPRFCSRLGLDTISRRVGPVLIRFAGTITQDDLALISQAIEEGCEQVNPNEW